MEVEFEPCSRLSLELLYVRLWLPQFDSLHEGMIALYKVSPKDSKYAGWIMGKQCFK